MTSNDDFLIPYPRKKFLRKFFRFFGKILLSLLARPTIIGRKNLPIHGPAILVGNHVAVLEIVMMAVYSPKIVEFLGAGDIPIDPNVAWLANLYGYIPIQRGTIDRTGIKKALSVLKQGGIIGVFPQGGIWETAIDQSRIGTAFLSQKGEAPVTPIGFGGVKGALKQILRLKRPKLIMNVGQTLELPSSREVEPYSRNELEAYTQAIWLNIFELLPEDERNITNRHYDETFDVKISLIYTDGSENINSDCGMSIEQSSVLGRFFHFPILLDALHRNLGLKVEVLQHVDLRMPPLELSKACREILDYLEINPGFFTYRFGIDVGMQIKSAFQTLIDLIQSQSGNLDGIIIVPLYEYRDSETGERKVVQGIPPIHSM
jgi:1-acyl-sn-glycerol-3-phosphate acyltransferase